MDEMHNFARDDVFPSWFANSIQKALAGLALNFQLSLQDATHVQVVAGAHDLASIIAIKGEWRWVEATINRAHPGGAAGTYDIYVTAANNEITNEPLTGSDHTNYAFALAIVEAGKTPTIVAKTVDVFRKVGSLEWSGTAIIRIDQTVPPVGPHAHRHATGQPDPIAPADIGAVATTTVAHRLHEPGDLRWTARPVLEEGWLTCDGSAVSRVTYKALFEVIGTTWGNGDGVSTFNLPPASGRVPVATGSGAGLTTRGLAAKGGEEKHKLTTGELAAHTHGEGAANYFHGTGTAGSAPEGAGTHPFDMGGVTEATGGGEEHNNMPPFIGFNLWIKT